LLIEKDVTLYTLTTPIEMILRLELLPLLKFVIRIEPSLLNERLGY